jgi:hypothetical protein
MNRYKIQFNVVADIPDEREQQDLGDYTAIVEADSAGEAERKALDEVLAINPNTTHHYLFNRIWDLGPVSNEEGPLD